MSNPILRNNANTIQDLIDGATSIGIILGENQNLDTVATSLSLSLSLQKMGKNVQVVSKKAPTVEFSNLFGIDKISNAFEGDVRILTISVPYREGEIEKVSYNIEGDKLNVNLFAEENGISFTEKDVEYIRKGSSPSLIITVGVLNENELSGLVDLKSVKTIHIDRNPQNTLFGDVSLIDPGFSSVSEIAAGIIMDLALPYDMDILQNLMDGITYATRNFTMQNTSAYAFEAAGFALQNGARRKKEEGQRQRDSRFPQESHFLNQRPPRLPRRDRNVRQPSPVNDWNDEEDVMSQPQPRQNKPVQNVPANQAGEAGFDNQPNMSKTPGETENAIPDDVPEDWFLPKVFKGSRKGN